MIPVSPPATPRTWVVGGPPEACASRWAVLIVYARRAPIVLGVTSASDLASYVRDDEAAYLGRADRGRVEGLVEDLLETLRSEAARAGGETRERLTREIERAEKILARETT